MAIAGFSVVFPFLPYYVQALGITEPGQVALWSGVIIAVQALTKTIFAPIWGSLADRYGRKLMIERATFRGAVVLALMGFVLNVEQLAALRAIQGTLTGTVAAAMTLVASSTPRERSRYAMGLLQTAVWIGSSVGPLIGGVVADALGYRAAFWVTGVLLFISGLTVWLFVKEDLTPPPRDQRHPRTSLWTGLKLVLTTSSLVALLAVRIIARLGTSLTTPIASLTGLISGFAAATSATSSVILQKRRPDRLPSSAADLYRGGGRALCSPVYCDQSLATADLAGSGRLCLGRRSRLDQRFPGQTGPGGPPGSGVWPGRQRHLGGRCRGADDRRQHGRCPGSAPALSVDRWGARAGSLSDLGADPSGQEKLGRHLPRHRTERQAQDRHLP